MKNFFYTMQTLMHKKKTMPAFSLIEMAIVLMVIGLIAGAVFKGKDLLENAKMRGVTNDFQQYTLAVHTYQDTYQALPGDDPRATNHFSDTQSGDGNGQITGREAELFWQHLYKATLISSDVPPTSKLGGRYTIVHQPNADMPGNWIMLAKEDGSGLLTPKQAQALKSKVDQGHDAINSNQGQVIIKDAPHSVGRCIKNGHLNLESQTPDCIAYYRF